MSLVRNASAKNWTKETCFNPSDNIPFSSCLVIKKP